MTIKTIDQLAEYLLLCKKQVVDDFKANHNADKIIEELSEEYFRKELDKGNIELVAIKLCVRLETVLKSKYHYEGDFSEMLEKYCSQYGVYEEDDGWGYIETRTHEFVTYLQKLRKYRNSIVHSEKKVDGMNVEELNFCIDYICRTKIRRSTMNKYQKYLISQNKRHKEGIFLFSIVRPSVNPCNDDTYGSYNSVANYFLIKQDQGYYQDCIRTCNF